MAGIEDLAKAASLVTELQPHQQRVVDRIQKPDQPGLLVVHGLGTGKTLSSIAAADKLNKQTTVVVPAALKPNYEKEIDKHVAPDTGPDMSVQSLQGLARTNLPIETKTLIVDEAHRLRDGGSSSAKAIRAVKANKRILLTATPFYNHPSDIAAPLNIAAGKTVLPENPKEFEKQYITRDAISPGFIAKLMGVTPGKVSRLNPAKEEELRQVFSKWVDYHQNPPGDPNFPEKKEETVKVPMTQKQQEVYDVVMNKAPLWLRMKVKMGLPPSVSEAQQLNAFLNAGRQISNTTARYSTMPVQQPKLEQAAQDMADVLEHNERAKAVAYSNYLESGLNPYSELLKAKHISHGLFTGAEDARTKAQMVKDYNEGKIRALLLSSAGGEGLDLKGTRLHQLLDSHWNEEKLNQNIGRSVRYKSHEALSPEERNVTVRRYLTTYPESKGLLHQLGLKKQDKSVDEYLHMLASQKDQLNQQFVNLLKPTE